MTTPPGSPPLAAIGLNMRVIALLAVLTIVTGLACGVVPAIRGARRDPIGSLKEPGPAATAVRRRLFPQGVLVSVQLALALVLLIGSGLLLNSLVRQVRRDLNFDPDGLVRVDYGVPAASYARRIGSYRGFPYFEIAPSASQTIERALNRLRAVPGAVSVAGISAPPVDSFVLATMEVTLEGADASATARRPRRDTTERRVFSRDAESVSRRSARPSCTDATSRTATRPPRRGSRSSTKRARAGSGRARIPIGKRLTLDTVPEEQSREVIGVVRDIPTRHAGDPQPVIYASYLQQPSRYRAPWAGLFGQMLFMIRPAGDPSADHGRRETRDRRDRSRNGRSWT